MTDFKKIQMEQLEWSSRNFGPTPAHRPLLGMIEELCELEAALNAANADGKEDEVLDAVGDVGIYMLDYCNKRGWDLQSLWERAPTKLGRMYDAISLISKLAHHQLKGEQNIRGGTAAHDAKLCETLAQILETLSAHAQECGTTFPAVLEKVWAKVSKRDWTKNPNDAHKVAEANDAHEVAEDGAQDA
jgi:NTP pyrophosphatase (non-canonical NTP hydrolase)